MSIWVFVRVKVSSVIKPISYNLRVVDIATVDGSLVDWVNDENLVLAARSYIETTSLNRSNLVIECRARTRLAEIARVGARAGSARAGCR